MNNAADDNRNIAYTIVVQHEIGSVMCPFDSREQAVDPKTLARMLNPLKEMQQKLREELKSPVIPICLPKCYQELYKI